MAGGEEGGEEGRGGERRGAHGEDAVFRAVAHDNRWHARHVALDPVLDQLSFPEIAARFRGLHRAACFNFYEGAGAVGQRLFAVDFSADEQAVRTEAGAVHGAPAARDVCDTPQPPKRTKCARAGGNSYKIKEGITIQIRHQQRRCRHSTPRTCAPSTAS